MSDSLFGSWKVFSTAPVIREESSLPAPPKGMKWQLDDVTKRWQLVKRPDTDTTSCDAPPELEQEAPLDSLSLVVDTLPPETFLDGVDDWELLSDKVSVSSVGLMVPRAGSVRSISSVDNDSSTFNGSVPFKIQRTLSNSTIDSENGDRALGMLGVDYMEHVILPSDTLQGICLAYKTSGTRLRQANHFSGSNLSGAPKKLIIPLSKKAIRSGYIHVQNKETKEYKIYAVMAELPADVKESEARTYLEQADWVVEDAVRSAIEDGEWENDVLDSHRSNSIDIKVVNGQFSATGAGLQKKEAMPPQKMVVYSDGVPAIATKTVRPQDVYNAAPQHNGYGVELKCIKIVEAPLDPDKA